MSTTLLVEAKREYTEQLVLFLRDAMYDDFYVMWKNSVDSPDPMIKFQEVLEEIVDWDEKTMIQKTDSCVSKTGCKYLDDLITAVFVAHMKILMSIKNDEAKERYRLQVPTTNKFVYECLLQCSRELWKSPYLFYQNESENKIKKVQIQKNLRQAEEIISAAVHNTIRGMLPVKEIVGDVFEYDKDGDLILDIKRPSGHSTDTSAKTSTQSLNVESVEDVSGSIAPTITPASTLAPTITPGVSDESGVSIRDAPVPGDKPLAHSPLTPDVSGVGVGVGVRDTTGDTGDTGDTGTEKDTLEKTIENIRVMNASHDDEFEYDPGVPSEDTVPEEVDWNKGFVLGPVEEDIKVETEALEPDSKEDVNMDDVIELG